MLGEQRKKLKTENGRQNKRKKMQRRGRRKNKIKMVTKYYHWTLS
jgi:hypothetical protein